MSTPSEKLTAVRTALHDLLWLGYKHDHPMVEALSQESRKLQLAGGKPLEKTGATPDTSVSVARLTHEEVEAVKDEILRRTNSLDWEITSGTADANAYERVRTLTRAVDKLTY